MGFVIGFSLSPNLAIHHSARGPNLEIAVPHCSGRSDPLTNIGVLSDEPLHRCGVDDACIGTNWPSVAPKLRRNWWPRSHHQRRHLRYLHDARIARDTVASRIGDPHRLGDARHVEHIPTIFEKERRLPWL